MLASEHLIDFLKEHEGFEPNLYCDPAGHCTVGYGHLVHLGKPGDDPRREHPYKHGITEAHGEELLLEDVSHAEWAVERLITAPLTQGQFDALVSFVFNVGVPAFEESTLRRVLNDRIYDAIPHLLLQWNHIHKEVSVGLTKRRLGEIVLWKS